MSQVERSQTVQRPPIASAVPPARKQAGNPVGVLTNVTAAAAKPWWGETFGVAATCLIILVAPLKIATQIAEAAVALAFLTVFGAIGLWYVGYIPDEEVARVLGQLGDRGLAILQASGII